MPETSTMVIDFRPTGEVQAMHRDAFNLSFLGNQKIERASDIRYDEAAQTWTIYVATDDGTFHLVSEARGFASYEEARKMEVRWFEMARLHSLSPLAAEGLLILRALRAQFD